MTLKRHSPRHGRKSFYLAAYADLAKSLALKGRTDAQMAAALSISESTFKNWRRRFPEFREAVRFGREVANARVERALFDRAVGIEMATIRQTLEPDKNGHLQVVQEIRESIPADPGAAKMWLHNCAGWKFGETAATATAHAVAGSVSVVAGVSDDVLERMREAGRTGNWQLADDSQPTLTADAEPGRELQPA